MDEFKAKNDYFKNSFYEMKEKCGIFWSAIALLVMVLFSFFYFLAKTISGLYERNKIANGKVEYFKQVNNSHILWFSNYVSPALGAIGVSRKYNDMFTGVLDECTFTFNYNLVGLTAEQQSRVRNHILSSLKLDYGCCLKELPFMVRIVNDELVISRRI